MAAGTESTTRHQSEKREAAHTGPDPGPSTWTGVRYFAQHFVEMVLAMQVGMLLFGLVAGGVLVPLGFTTAAQCDSDVHRIGMTVFMTVTMVAWMRVRGHGWRHGAEMAAVMIVPTAAFFVLRSLQLEGAATWVALLGASCGPAMYLGMLAVMLYRREHYVGNHTHVAHAH